MPPNELPKKIWMYWSQGADNLPFLVQQCAESWQSLNPDWEFILIDDNTLSDYVDLEGLDSRADITLQALSDILRVKLLMAHGGVWVDASLFCARPLDEWLYDALDDHFFAFASHRKDRLMTTWFLAGTANSEVLNAWTSAMMTYWQSNRFRGKRYWVKQVLRKLTSLRKRELVSNKIWFSHVILKTLRIFPYPINMYLFEEALCYNTKAASNWQNSQHLYDAPAEHLQNNLGMNTLMTEISESYLREDSTPVHKLNWRQDLGEAKKGTNFALLLKILCEKVA